MITTTESNIVELMVATEGIPLERSADGVVRVRETQITLDMVLAAYNEGATPEEMALKFSLELADVHAVIGGYLRWRLGNEARVQQLQQEADRRREYIQPRFDSTGEQERSLARRFRYLDYIDFELGIGHGHAHEYLVTLVRSPELQLQSVMRFPLDERTVRNHIQNLEIALLRSMGNPRHLPSRQEKDVQEFGKILFDTLFTGDILKYYDEDQEKAVSQGRRLRLKLHIESPELAALPWELLYYPRRGAYVCQLDSASVIRHPLLSRPMPPIVADGPLRVLGMVASPSDMPPIDVTHEQQRLVKAIQDMESNGRVELEWLKGQTWRDLQEAMNTGTWHVVHFVGYGRFSRSANEGFISLVSQSGQPLRLGATQLARLLTASGKTGLVLLNLGRRLTNTNRSFSSTAATLVRMGIPAVVETPYEIADQTVHDFISTLYEALVESMPVDAAVAEARKAVGLAAPNTVAWGAPVLYTGLANNALFSNVRSKGKMTPTISTTVFPPRKLAISIRPTPLVRPAPQRFYFILPDLVHQKSEQRLGRGIIRQVIPLSKKKRLVVAIAGGGAALLALGAKCRVLWEIDCPTQCGAFFQDETNETKLVLASGQRIYIIDVRAGQLLCTLQGHTDRIECLTFSPNGKILASGSRDATVRLWRIVDKQVVCDLIFKGHTRSVKSVAFSSDGKLVASGSSDNTVHLWDLNGKIQRKLEGHTDSVESVAISPDGELLASGSSDKTVRLWRMKDGELLHTLEEHSRSVYSLAFSAKSDLLASGSSDGMVRVWDAKSGMLLNTLGGFIDEVRSVAFLDDGKTVLGVQGTTIQLWTVADGDASHKFESHTGAVQSVAFSPNGEQLAVGSTDRTVRLWYFMNGKELQSLSKHTQAVHSVAFSSDGKHVASGSSDETVRLWLVAERSIQKNKLTKHTGAVWSVAFLPERESQPGLWERRLGGPEPNRTMLASGSSDKTVRIWKWNGELEQTLKGHKDRVTSVVFSPDGEMLASGSADKAIWLWRISAWRWRRSRVLEGHGLSQVTSIAFSPDRKFVASGSDDNIVRLWQCSDGKLHSSLEEHKGPVRSVAFSPNGEFVASGSDDMTVRMWHVGDRVSRVMLNGHTEPITSVAFSPDGKYLASGSSDGTVRLWRVPQM